MNGYKLYSKLQDATSSATQKKEECVSGLHDHWLAVAGSGWAYHLIPASSSSLLLDKAKIT